MLQALAAGAAAGNCPSAVQCDSVHLRSGQRLMAPRVETLSHLYREDWSLACGRGSVGLHELPQIPSEILVLARDFTMSAIAYTVFNGTAEFYQCLKVVRDIHLKGNFPSITGLLVLE